MREIKMRRHIIARIAGGRMNDKWHARLAGVRANDNGVITEATSIVYIQSWQSITLLASDPENDSAYSIEAYSLSEAAIAIGMRRGGVVVR